MLWSMCVCMILEFRRGAGIGGKSWGISGIKRYLKLCSSMRSLIISDQGHVASK